MINNLKWICEDDNIVKMKTISKVENIFGIKFPNDYIEIVMNNNGGYPNPNRFDLNGNEEVFNNLLSFTTDDCSNIIDTYNYVKINMAEKIIPFAEDPFGNLLCFDYRNNDQSTVVFWEHEKSFIDKELATTYLCKSFSELLLLLHESQEE